MDNGVDVKLEEEYCSAIEQIVYRGESKENFDRLLNPLLKYGKLYTNYEFAEHNMYYWLTKGAAIGYPDYIHQLELAYENESRAYIARVVREIDHTKTYNQNGNYISFLMKPDNGFDEQFWWDLRRRWCSLSLFVSNDTSSQHYRSDSIVLIADIDFYGRNLGTPILSVSMNAVESLKSLIDNTNKDSASYTYTINILIEFYLSIDSMLNHDGILRRNLADYLVTLGAPDSCRKSSNSAFYDRIINFRNSSVNRRRYFKCLIQELEEADIQMYYNRLFEDCVPTGEQIDRDGFIWTSTVVGPFRHQLQKIKFQLTLIERHQVTLINHEMESVRLEPSHDLPRDLLNIVTSYLPWFDRLELDPNDAVFLIGLDISRRHRSCISSIEGGRSKRVKLN